VALPARATTFTFNFTVREIMSNNTASPEFWQRVDAVINLVNDQSEATSPSEAGASALFASARFNAFLLAQSTGSAENMALEKERALEYFTGQFREMMVANIDNFIENYAKFMQPNPQ